MNVSFIIPNFNGLKLLQKNLPAVLGIKDVLEIIIVDDGSTDGSVSYLNGEISRYKKSGQTVKLVINDKNLGFSSAVNRGVKEAKGEVIVLLNTDVSPEENFLDYLIKHFQNQQVFAVGCLDKSIENGKAILRGRGVGEWKKGFLIHSRGEIDKTDTLWVSCGSGAFKKEIWEKLGGLDEIYNPFYWEDIDLSYRAQKAGYKVLFEPKSIVTHRHEEGIIQQKYSAFQIRIIAYRNQIIFVWKNITDLWFLLSHIFWLPYYILKSFLTMDTSFLKGLIASFFRLPQIFNSRQKSKKISSKTDREILSGFE